LPTGSGGDLFIPVDTSVMGAGIGPLLANGSDCVGYPVGCASYTQNRAAVHLHGGRTPWISDGTPHQWIIPYGDNVNTPYKQGVSLQNVPDMPMPDSNTDTFSDNVTNYNATTYYFTNQQSARLMFYHDHAFGITRLNVYAGEAAGYLITDKYEQDLIDRGIIPGTKSAVAGGGTVMGGQIPLIIQDKTFVNADVTTHPASGGKVMTVREMDPLWNWGSGAVSGGIRTPVTGDLWMPHVYMPAQTSIAGAGGVNPFGRWMYGPWFYPPTAVEKGPVDNPYYDPNCGSSDPFFLAQCETAGQPEKIPGTPNVSMGMEAFQDSVVVNGTVFPTLTVDPKAYRFRILNAASDRFQNLSFYEADSNPANRSTAPYFIPGDPKYRTGLSNKTEVKMLPASAHLASVNNWPALWPTDGRDGGVPDPAFRGPSFIQIGSEGGFLPKPVTIDPQPITYITDPTAFWVGVVDGMGLALGPAERADVIVDFSAYRGKTLILYNDAPAAWPARVPGYDYYTGAPDMRDSGGYGTGGTLDPATGAWVDGTGPLPGYAPNTRTVMQVIVRDINADTAFNKTALDAEFTSAAPVTSVNPAPAKTLFERSQEPIIVGQAAYKDAYPNSYFPPNFPWEGINQMNDHFLKFVTLAGEEVYTPTHPKGIHDEMGASFDPVYGRMSGNLAMQRPNPTTLNALLVLYGFSDLPTETVENSTTLNVQVLSPAGTYNDPVAPFNNPTYFDPVISKSNITDGTQIWKISHNGVDTHPIHFHIFDVQLINRVGWDGQIKLPEPNELGWKDTIKISPLMDTIVAVRPRAPALPFGIPKSNRPLNPAIPIDSPMGFNAVDWVTGQARPAGSAGTKNILYDFGWEYVWHCHILSHEEMDMMRPIVVNVATTVPDAPTITSINAGIVTWTDPTPVNYVTTPGETVASDPETYRNPKNEIGFNVLRSTGGAGFVQINTTVLPANSTTYTDPSPVADTVYKVEAFNASGSTFSPVYRPVTVILTLTNTPGAAPATVDLQADVSGVLPGGVSVTTVQFYNGTTLLGASASGANPYSYNWTSVMGGTYSLSAKVTDNTGAVFVSNSVSVPITGNITANFTPPAPTGYCDPLTLTDGSTGGNSWSWLIDRSGIPDANITIGTQNTTVAGGTLVPAVYPVTLTVTNTGTGETAQVTKNVTVINNNPVPTTTGPYVLLPTNANITLGGSATDADTCNTTLSYAWNVDNIGNYDYLVANPTITYNTLNNALGIGVHTLTFKATDDNKGGIGTATTTLSINAAAPASITVPATSSTGSYSVSWAASSPSGITYTLEESTDPTFATAVTTTTDAVSPVLITGKANGTKYYYRVKAVPNNVLLAETAWTTDAVGCTIALGIPAFVIENGASVTKNQNVTLTISANAVDTMSFSNDGITYSTPEAYSATKTGWSLTAGDGLKTVYVKVSNAAQNVVYNAVSSQITLDTVAPVTSPSNLAGNYTGALSVILTANESSVIKYSVDGTDPTTSGTAVVYTTAIPIDNTTTLKYFATDMANNVETVKTGVYTILPAYFVVNEFKINGGAAETASTTVTLSISASDASGITKMRFSNDGITYSADENYATTKTWTLSSGDGLKTVYVKFTAGAGLINTPATAQITLNSAFVRDGLLPGTTTHLASALRAMKISVGLVTPTSTDLLHGDVAPYSNGTSHPDGVINGLDAFTLLLRSIGVISQF